MQLDRDGACHYPAALGPPECAALEAAVAEAPATRPGVRIAGNPALATLLAANGTIGAHAAAVLGPASRPVRALLFNKTPDTNWSLGWHQDRTIAVRRKVDTPDYGPWTIKSGMHHVEPPFALLERMLTMRIHLDPVAEDNAPLLIAPGSHRLGRIPEREIETIVARHGARPCLARPGDIWLYATPILHASEAARAPRARRVLQLDFSADPLPPPLEWLGV